MKTVLLLNLESSIACSRHSEMFLKGTWVVQSVERLILDFSADHDPRVVGSSPTSGSALSVEPA